MAGGTVLSGEQTGNAACPHLLGARPGPFRSQPPTHRSVVLALRRDQRHRMPSDRLQLLSWNPEHSRTSDPSLLASHLNGPWHSLQQNSAFYNDVTLQGNFYVATQYGCAVLLNKDTFEPTTRVFPCLSLAISGMPQGPSRAWLLLASSAEPRKVVHPLHGRQRSHQQTSPPKGGPCVSRCCCSYRTCASSSVQWCSPAT